MDQVEVLSAELRDAGKILQPKKTTNSFRNRLIPFVAVVALLFAAAVLAYPKIFKRNSLERLRASGDKVSVAVMPFQNMTNDTLKSYWQEMVQDNLITTLSNSGELKVRQTESISSLLRDKEITDYASLTPAIASNISQKLDATVFIYGSINQIGSLIRLNAKLIDSNTDEIIKSFQKDGTSENILSVVDTLSAMVRDFLVLSKLKQKEQTVYELSASTLHPEAYRYYVDGKEAFFKGDLTSARDLLLKAYDIDSNLTYAATLIVFTFSNQGNRDEARKWVLKLYEKKDQMSLVEKTEVNRLHAVFFETPQEAIKYTKQLLEFDDQNPRLWYNLGYYYTVLDQFENAIPAYEKSLEIYKNWQSKPLWVASYTALGDCYHQTGKFRSERKLLKMAEKDFPDDPILAYQQARVAFTHGNTDEGNKYVEKYEFLCKTNGESEESFVSWLASGFIQDGLPDLAKKYCRELLSFQSVSPNILNNLAFRLLSDDRTINEALELAEKALGANPEDPIALHRKGWGLYKQGKYEEALEPMLKSQEIRIKAGTSDQEFNDHLEAVMKAVAELK